MNDAKVCLASAGMYCTIGLSIPIAPVLISITALLGVRILRWNRKKSVLWNLTVCGLGILACGATIEGSDMNVAYAFWLGILYGALGEGIIEIGKSAMINGFKARLSDGVGAFMGMRPDGKDKTGSDSDL